MTYSISDMLPGLWFVLKICGIIGVILAGLIILFITIVSVVVGLEDDDDYCDDFGYMICMAEQEKAKNKESGGDTKK